MDFLRQVEGIELYMEWALEKKIKIFLCTCHLGGELTTSNLINSHHNHSVNSKHLSLISAIFAPQLGNLTLQQKETIRDGYT